MTTSIQTIERKRVEIDFMYLDLDVCTRCGLCVDRCPTGVVIMGKAGVASRGGDAHQRDNKHGYSYGMRF